MGISLQQQRNRKKKQQAKENEENLLSETTVKFIDCNTSSGY